MKTLFVEAQMNYDLKPVLKKAAEEIKFEKISLLTTVQHVHQIQEAKKLLEKEGKAVHIGTPLRFKDLVSKQGIYSIHQGQILGCDASAALDVIDKVDCTLYIGTGHFHPLEILFKTNKPVYIADPFYGKVEELNQDYKKKYLAKQAARMANAKEAKCFGILLSTKPGQYYLSAVKQIKDLAKKHGKEAVVLLGDTIDPQGLLDFNNVDCYINTACPRIVEDQARYPKTVINFTEFMDIFGGDA